MGSYCRDRLVKVSREPASRALNAVDKISQARKFGIQELVGTLFLGENEKIRDTWAPQMKKILPTLQYI